MPSTKQDPKVCTWCKESKPRSEFKPKSYGGYVEPCCSTCYPEYKKQYYLRDKTSGIWHEAHYQRTYSISLAMYDEMFQEQEGLCAICNKEQSYKRLAVDHNHKTNEVRGLLCDRCNKGLGFFDDNVESLFEAINYLRNWNKGGKKK